MRRDKRNPPDGPRRVSWISVVAGGRDAPRDKRPQSKKQAARGLVPIGQVAAEIVAGLRFRRQVERVHALGPRAVAELLAGLGAERSIMTLINEKLDTFAELDPEAVTAAAGDDFWPAPLSVV